MTKKELQKAIRAYDARIKIQQEKIKAIQDKEWYTCRSIFRNKDWFFCRMTHF